MCLDSVNDTVVLLLLLLLPLLLLLLPLLLLLLLLLQLLFQLSGLFGSCLSICLHPGPAQMTNPSQAALFRLLQAVAMGGCFEAKPQADYQTKPNLPKSIATSSMPQSAQDIISGRLH